MKELSIEEKAKLYDEAIIRAKSLIGDTIIEESGQHIAEVIFPELAESEDERIKREIIEFMCHQMDKFKDAPNIIKKYNEWIAWLEKQGEQKPFDYESATIVQHDFAPKFKVGDIVQYITDSTDRRKIVEIDTLCNMYHTDDDNSPIMFEVEDEWKVVVSAEDVEQEPVVKPKFSCGEWVINRTNAIIMQIVNNEDFYESVEIGGQRRTDTYNYVEWNFRLWTIKDAKDCDVLFHSDSASNGIFIFKELLKYEFGEKVICYCDYDSEDHFCLGEHHTCCWADAKILHPATKEQRDALMKAMTDAGYTFDFEKKELKKVEDGIEIPFGAKDSELQEVTYYIPKGFHAEIDDDKVVIKKGEKPTTWSEEDENGLSDALWCCKQAASIAKDENDMGNAWYAEHWLKSLKDRYAWKPSDKQMKAIEHICDGNYNVDLDILDSIYRDFKKLRKK